MDVKLYGRDGSVGTGTVTLNDDIFGIEPNDHAIYLDVRSIQANARQGTHKVKSRGEVRGGGKKPKRQKGTGGARAGTIRSGLFVGGGSIFGPKPHEYSLKVNKKTKRLARVSALAYKAQADGVFVMEDFTVDQPKTRTFVDLLGQMGLGDRKILFLTAETDEMLYKSGRNLPKVRVLEAAKASTIDILHAHAVVFQQGALKVLEAVLLGESADDDATTTDAVA